MAAAWVGGAGAGVLAASPRGGLRASGCCGARSSRACDCRGSSPPERSPVAAASIGLWLVHRGVAPRRAQSSASAMDRLGRIGVLSQGADTFTGMKGRDATALWRLFRLFMVAFAPLALILAIRTARDWRSCEIRMYVFWLAVAWAALGFVDAWRLPRGALRKGSIQAEFYDVQDQSGAIAAYLATFLLPFVGLEFSTIQELLGMLVYFLVVWAIFVQSDLAAINPTLYIFGYRVVRAHVRSTAEIDPIVVVLVPRKSNLVCDQPVSVVRFGKFLVRKEEKEVQSD